MTMTTHTTTQAQERFRALVPILQNMNALVVGCGSIGSHLIAMLARMQPASIYCIDHDDVSEENLGVQNFKSSDVGNSKAYIIARNNDEATIIEPFAMRFSQFSANYLENRIKAFTHIFMCVDTMKVRREIFDATVNKHAFNGILVDGRLDANMGWVYACRPFGTDWYDKTLHSDEEGIKVANCCAIRMTAYSAHGIASIMIAQAMRLSQDESLNNLKCGMDYNNMLFFSK